MKKKYCFRKVRGLCLCTIALTLFALLSACTTLVKPYPFDAAATAVEGRWGFTASDSRYYRGGLVFSEQPDPIRIGETIFDFNGNSYISYVNGNPAFKGSIRFEGDVLCLLPTEKHFNGDNPRWAGLEKDIFDDIKSMERRYSYKVNGDNLVLSIEGLDYTGTKMDSASEVTPDYYKTLPIAADQSYVKVIGTDNFHTIM
ncbi:MAG: hypothetical protein LBM77_01990, partial [Spirochaetaceae bacterium]|nr:hypothetical protein [Spirochaetaceae bacterium]